MPLKYIFLLMVVLVSCRPTSIYTPESVKMDTSKTDLKNFAGQRIEISGEIKKLPFESKKGLIKEKFEYWLFPGGKNEKILLRPADSLEMENRLNRPVTAKGILFYGNIDETESQKQSRHGYRLDQVIWLDNAAATDKKTNTHMDTIFGEAINSPQGALVQNKSGVFRMEGKDVWEEKFLHQRVKVTGEIVYTKSTDGNSYNGHSDQMRSIKNASVELAR